MARHISWESPNRQVVDINGPAHHNIVEITAALEAAADNGIMTVPEPWRMWADELMLQLHDAGLHVDAIRGYIQMFDDCKLRRVALRNAMVSIYDRWWRREDPPDRWWRREDADNTVGRCSYVERNANHTASSTRGIRDASGYGYRIRHGHKCESEQG